MMRFDESQQPEHTHGIDDGQLRVWTRSPGGDLTAIAAEYLRGYYCGDDVDGSAEIVCGSIVAADGRRLARYSGRPDGAPTLELL
jgi:hypothetical protein